MTPSSQGWVTLGVLVAMAACARGPALSGRIDGLRDVVEQAERNGAYRCAPRELALAKAELEFAQTELAQGNPSRAQDHFIRAEPNARAAFRLSPPEKCAPREVVIAGRPTGDRDGDGVVDAQDACPDDPEDFDAVDDEDGCPEEQDTDGDGLPDVRDACGLEPEDTDGYLDQDGCPEPDNDLDSVPDEQDACANDPEDPDGYEDEDGCPDRDNDADSVADSEDRCPNQPGPVADGGCPRQYQDVQVTRTAIRIAQKIHFEFNKSVIRRVSFPILRTVAQVLRDYPDIAVEIQGHTDSRGSDEYNRELSHGRANAVLQFLQNEGIAAHRMRAQGYGEARPIESNRTSSGRAANRRVEFIRTDAGARSATPSASPSRPQSPVP